jgi:hypothetical protein
MSCGLEFFSTEVSAAPPKVIAHVPPNELYSFSNENRKQAGLHENSPLRSIAMFLNANI